MIIEIKDEPISIIGTLSIVQLIDKQVFVSIDTQLDDAEEIFVLTAAHGLITQFRKFISQGDFSHVQGFITDQQFENTIYVLTELAAGLGNVALVNQLDEDHQ